MIRYSYQVSTLYAFRSYFLLNPKIMRNLNLYTDFDLL